MTFQFNADNLDCIHEHLVERLLEDPDYEASPRGQPIKELIGASFTLTNPRARIIASRVRNVNYGFAVGEFCWYARGDEDLATMAYYNKRMPQFSDDGKTLNSAYGARIFNCLHDSLISQWDSVEKELIRDPDSRRAIMVINQPRDLLRAVKDGSKDVPCTLALQLLIRGRKLHMSVTMRSNDVWWGLPYDVFSFTCLQEAMMLELRAKGVPVDDVGQYHHHAGSLHLYDRHFKPAAEVVHEISERRRAQPMQPFDLEQLQTMADVHEPDIRLNKCDKLGRYDDFEPNSVDWMIEQLFTHRKKRNEEKK
jgi:thymidylate synthase